MNAPDAILAPFLGMMLLTLAVWVTMYTRRIHYMVTHRVHAQRMTTPERVAELIPEPVAGAANNLKNLFEIPVLFYALCLYLYVTASANSVDLALAWAFLGLRTLHSIVHCGPNIVMLRFVLYASSSLLVWLMLARAVAGYLF
ncbi:MAG: MAPEG family protein [Pseudomonadota bacterium]